MQKVKICSKLPPERGKPTYLDDPPHSGRTHRPTSFLDDGANFTDLRGGTGLVHALFDGELEGRKTDLPLTTSVDSLILIKILINLLKIYAPQTTVWRLSALFAIPWPGILK